MEDMDESRRILENHNWDLLQAISSQMGFEQLPPQLFDRGPAEQNQQVRASSSSASFARTPVVVQDDSLLNVVRRSQVGSGNGGNYPGPFGWVWRILSAPVNLIFRYLWEFLGFGLRLLRHDPRRGSVIFIIPVSLCTCANILLWIRYSFSCSVNVTASN
jgi:hypothetical protein